VIFFIDENLNFQNLIAAKLIKEWSCGPFFEKNSSRFINRSIVKKMMA